MNSDSIRRMVRFAGLILPLTWIPGPLPGQMVKAESFGVFVSTATVKQTMPSAVLSAGGGLAQDQASDVTVGTWVTAQNAFAIASGEADGSYSDAVSSATLGNVNILQGRITADAVVAIASSTKNGSDTDGSTIANLVVDGVAMSDPAPNTRVELPGVGYVLLNERLPGKGGGNGLTVNMIHVVMQDGDIIVGSATSKVN